MEYDRRRIPFGSSPFPSHIQTPNTLTDKEYPKKTSWCQSGAPKPFLTRECLHQHQQTKVNKQQEQPQHGKSLITSASASSKIRTLLRRLFGAVGRFESLSGNPTWTKAKHPSLHNVTKPYKTQLPPLFTSLYDALTNSHHFSNLAQWPRWNSPAQPPCARAFAPAGPANSQRRPRGRGKRPGPHAEAGWLRATDWCRRGPSGSHWHHGKPARTGGEHTQGSTSGEGK